MLREFFTASGQYLNKLFTPETAKQTIRRVVIGRVHHNFDRLKKEKNLTGAERKDLIEELTDMVELGGGLKSVGIKPEEWVKVTETPYPLDIHLIEGYGFDQPKP